MELFPRWNCVNTSVWIYHSGTKKMHREKTRWELHKNATCIQVKKCTPGTVIETTRKSWATFWVPLSYGLVPHLSKKLSKFPFYKRLRYGRTSVGRHARTYIIYMWRVDVVLRIYRKQWIRGTDGEREEKIHVVSMIWRLCIFI